MISTFPINRSYNFDTILLPQASQCLTHFRSLGLDKNTVLTGDMGLLHAGTDCLKLTVFSVVIEAFCIFGSASYTALIPHRAEYNSWAADQRKRLKAVQHVH